MPESPFIDEWDELEIPVDEDAEPDEAEHEDE